MNPGIKLMEQVKKQKQKIQDLADQHSAAVRALAVMHRNVQKRCTHKHKDGKSAISCAICNQCDICGWNDW